MYKVKKIICMQSDLKGENHYVLVVGKGLKFWWKVTYCEVQLHINLFSQH